MLQDVHLKLYIYHPWKFFPCYPLSYVTYLKLYGCYSFLLLLPSQKQFKNKNLPSGYAGLHDMKKNKCTLEDIGFLLTENLPTLFSNLAKYTFATYFVTSVTVCFIIFVQNRHKKVNFDCFVLMLVFPSYIFCGPEQSRFTGFLLVIFKEHYITYSTVSIWLPLICFTVPNGNYWKKSDHLAIIRMGFSWS